MFHELPLKQFSFCAKNLLDFHRAGTSITLAPIDVDDLNNCLAITNFFSWLSISQYLIIVQRKLYRFTYNDILFVSDHLDYF